jgi:hypothetical protein
MATRLNTIEYAFDLRTSPAYTLAAATRHDFVNYGGSQLNVYIPETTSRTFISAYVEICARDASSATSSRASLSSWLIGIKFGANAFDDVTVTDTMTDTGEQISYIWKRDVTARFTAQFTGSSQAVQVGFQFATSSATNPVILTNISAKLVITYSYDDTSGATTRIKTVRIPLESHTDTVPLTTLTQIGTNQIPNLDTFLPEDTTAYRCKFFEISGNEAIGATTDTTLTVALDAETPGFSFSPNENANNSSCFDTLIWTRSDMTTNGTHAFMAKMAGVAGYNNLCVVLVVTYEYTEATTSTVINSLAIPWHFEDVNLYNSSGYKSRYSRSFNLCEPGSLTLVQSGVMIYSSAVSAANQSCAIGSQAYRTYTTNAGSVTCGQVSLTQRFDSGGAQGAGASISDNAITITIDSYSASLAVYTNVCGIIYLNYTSDKATTGGTGVHAKTIKKLTYATAADGTAIAIGSPTLLDIPETYYGIISAGVLMETESALTQNGTNIAVSQNAGEGSGGGYRTIISTTLSTDPELGRKSVYADATDLFDRFDGDYDSKRLAVEGARYWKADTISTAYKSFEHWVSYHGHYFQIMGQVFQSAGGTVTIKYHDATTDECLTTTTRTGNGPYTTYVFDPRAKYTVGYESATRIGRSANGTPTRQ